MSYAALLFCPDDKTTRVLTQVLSDLEFAVDPCTEPFVAVKKLMAQRFDAVVVDCDNDQNAALMFKSVRNSEGNQAALTVAVVGDQAGVAKAFRLGANLVLTKPINVEQSKGTLRVARGLLKKGDAAKPAVSTSSASAAPRPSAPPASIASTSKAPIQIPAQKAPSAPAIPVIAASALELEPEPVPQASPDDAALLESMPAPANPLQKVKPVAPEPKAVPQPAAHADAYGSSAAAAAPAKEVTPEKERVEQRPAATVFTPPKSVESAPEISGIKASDSLSHSDAPLFSSVTASAGDEGSDGNGKKIAIGAVAVIAVAAMGYFGFSKGHSHPAATATTQPATQPIQPELPAASSAPIVAPATSSAMSSPAVHAKTDTTPSINSSTTKSSAQTSGSIEKSEKSPEKPSSTKTAAAAEEEVEPLMVKSEAPRQAPQPVAETPTPAAPDMDVAGGNSGNALPGIVSSAAVNIPKPSAQTLMVSQGVSQGLLVKKVDPIYPRQAMQSRIQGAVQLEANIGKDGSITSVKVLSGDQVLSRAAIDAVKQWKYKPYFLDGQPIEIQTQITMNFRLP